MKEDAMPAARAFVLLDALRGCAALFIAFRHYAELFNVRALPNSYLAVDFFFVLSGFVLAHAYEHRLAAGFTSAAFLRKRIKRVYPLYLFGTLIGIVGWAVHPFSTFATPASLAIAVCSGLFGLPLLAHARYPLNYPGWSLFDELLVNAVYALGLRRLGDRALLAAVAVCFVFVCWAGVTNGSLDGGADASTFPIGLARAAFGFAAGVFVHRRYLTHPGAGGRPLLICTLFLFSLNVPPLAPLEPWSDLATVAVYPWLVLVAARTPIAEERARRRATLLGALSFPLYAIHYPIAVGILACEYRFGVTFPRPLIGVVAFAAVTAFALAIGVFIDRPPRRKASL